MNYNDFLGILPYPEIESDLDVHIKPRKTPNNSDFEFVRYGEPKGVLSHKAHKDDIQKLVRHHRLRGWEAGFPTNIHKELLKHVALFRVSLDFWEEFSTDRVFCKEEIYERCLLEGPSFTEFIKKSRQTCLRALTSETGTDIDEEYYFDTYTGYNSIIHERYLIHWDDRDEIDDVKYAFIPARDFDIRPFERMVDRLFKDFRVGDLSFVGYIDMISSLKNSMMHDVGKGTTLMREAWSEENINLDEPYYAKRCVVPTDPGSTRDTGIGTPSTVVKVKYLNQLARTISEQIPYMANAPGPVCNSRLKRILKKNAFLHLDFKKYGLSFPRLLTNAMIRKMGEISGIDVSQLIIDIFLIEMEDGSVYETERGTVLGWLDAVNALCVAAILHSMTEELNFDFITFNDDVEIAIRSVKDIPHKLEMLRGVIVKALSSFDIPISLNKTYGSKGSIFLERYCYFDRHYGLDMYKEQLTVRAYAMSCVTKYPWKAKMYFSAAEQWTKSKYANDRCIDTCEIEFSQDEKGMPLWAGGWFTPIRNKIDYSLQMCDDRFMRFGIQLAKWKAPSLTTQPRPYSKAEEASRRMRNAYFRREGAHVARHSMGAEDTIEEINLEASVALETVLSSACRYAGDPEYGDQALSVLRRFCGPEENPIWEDWGYDPGGEK